MHNWEQDLNLETVTDWNLFYKLPFSITKDSCLLSFQVRIVHRILATNRLLTKMNIKDSDNCSFYQNNVESLVNLFWVCGHIQMFWNDIINDLDQKVFRCTMDGTKKIFFLPLRSMLMFWTFQLLRHFYL